MSEVWSTLILLMWTCTALTNDIHMLCISSCKLLSVFFILQLFDTYDSYKGKPKNRSMCQRETWMVNCQSVLWEGSTLGYIARDSLGSLMNNFSILQWLLNILVQDGSATILPVRPLHDYVIQLCKATCWQQVPWFGFGHTCLYWWQWQWRSIMIYVRWRDIYACNRWHWNEVHCAGWCYCGPFAWAAEFGKPIRKWSTWHNWVFAVSLVWRASQTMSILRTYLTKSPNNHGQSQSFAQFDQQLEWKRKKTIVLLLGFLGNRDAEDLFEFISANRIQTCMWCNCMCVCRVRPFGFNCNFLEQQNVEFQLYILCTRSNVRTFWNRIM